MSAALWCGVVLVLVVVAWTLGFDAGRCDRQAQSWEEGYRSGLLAVREFLTREDP